MFKPANAKSKATVNCFFTQPTTDQAGSFALGRNTERSIQCLAMNRLDST